MSSPFTKYFSNFSSMNLRETTKWLILSEFFLLSFRLFGFLSLVSSRVQSPFSHSPHLWVRGPPDARGYGLLDNVVRLLGLARLNYLPSKGFVTCPHCNSAPSINAFSILLPVIPPVGTNPMVHRYRRFQRVTYSVRY